MIDSHMPSGFPQQKWFAAYYGLIHTIVDATSVTVLFGTLSIHHIEPRFGYGLVVFYNLLAFGSQALLGHLSDKLRSTRAMILCGILLAALGVAFVDIQPVPAIVLVGLGNALFHVGAGALSLHVAPGRAAAPGIFVGPGALGLAFGTWMGKNGIVYAWPMLAALSVAFVFALYSKNPAIPYDSKPQWIEIDSRYRILGLLLVSVAVRSAVGMVGSHECPRTAWVSPALALAVFGGKSFGGILSDRLGWTRTSVSALVLSAPLIAFAGSSPAGLAIGLFFFQMTMPVTLAAIAAVMPGRPAFAFGLASLVLILGALPTFYPPSKLFFGPTLFFCLILLSAASLFAGLRLLRRKVPMKFNE